MPRETHWWMSVKIANGPKASAAGAIHMSKGITERDIETRVPDTATTMVLYCGEAGRPRWWRMRSSGWVIATISLDGGWKA
jgi:hypothetical protein